MQNNPEKLLVPARPSMKDALVDQLNQRRVREGMPLLNEADVNEMFRVERAAERGLEKLKAKALASEKVGAFSCFLERIKRWGNLLLR